MLLIIIRILIGSREPDMYKPKEDEIRIIEEFINSIEKKSIAKPDHPREDRRNYYHNLRKFDPNHVVIEELQDMGFPMRVSGNIQKYRLSGGKFHCPEDLKKIYGLSDSAYQLILPFISIEQRIPGKVLKDNKPLMNDQVLIHKESGIVEINSADSLQLISLKGIGPVFASRIIKYRKMLGGFIYPEQLLEIYGMTPESLLLFQDKVRIDTMIICKMNINEISIGEMISHPYIDQEMAESILKFREFRGKINNIRDLYLFNIADKKKLQKIEPYFSVDE